jgi:hypothetical protein
MTVRLTEKLGGLALILGSFLLTAYSALVAILLPFGDPSRSFVDVVLNPNWVWLAIVAFISVLLMLAGFGAVYARLRPTAGAIGEVGYLFIQAAYLLQACKITWELFLYPIIASHPGSAFLLRDATIIKDPAVAAFLAISAFVILIGIVLFCFALYRSDAYPKSAAILIFAGALAYATGSMISIFVAIAGVSALAIGCLLLGMRLLKPAAREPQPI